MQNYPMQQKCIKDMMHERPTINLSTQTELLVTTLAKTIQGYYEQSHPCYYITFVLSQKFILNL